MGRLPLLRRPGRGLAQRKRVCRVQSAQSAVPVASVLSFRRGISEFSVVFPWKRITQETVVRARDQQQSHVLVFLSLIQLVLLFDAQVRKYF